MDRLAQGSRRHAPAEAVLGFVADTGVTDAALLAELEQVLTDLEREVRR